MHGTISKRAAEARPIDRREFRETEENFGSIMADVARLLWPKGTAVEIAALIGCTVRNAELQLSGQQKWSGDALAAIVAEILKRHAMRNVKITKRF